MKRIKITQNTDVDFDVRFVDRLTLEPIDIGVYTPASGGDIRANFVKSDLTHFTKTLSASGGIIAISTCAGKIGIHLSAVDTLNFPADDEQNFEVELIKNVSLSGQTTTVVQFLKSINVVPRI